MRTSGASPTRALAGSTPIVGARYRTELGDKWRIGLRGDFGGFGAGSEFAWYVNAFASRRLTDRLALTLGYRVWDFDREGDEDILEFYALPVAASA